MKTLSKQHHQTRPGRWAGAAVERAVGGGTRRRARVTDAGFNPALPEDHALIVAGVLRDQFNGLKTLIDAVPVVSEAEVDSVQTVPPESPAEAWVELSQGVLRFTFAIPQGMVGNQGTQGDAGPQGPPFAQAMVDGVQTLNPGEPAWVEVWFDGTLVHFSFGIPQGLQGLQGPQGAPGEVSSAQLSEAIQGTSSNSNGVGELSPFAPQEYDPSQCQAMIDKMNELIQALRR